MNKRILTGFCALFFALSAIAQTTVIEAKQLKAIDSVKVNGKWVKSVVTDSSLLGVTHRDLPSAQAVKDFATNHLQYKVNIGDTAAMLSAYARIKLLTDSLTAVQTRIQTKLAINDTTAMLIAYARVKLLTDSLAAIQSRIQTKLAIADTATMLLNRLKISDTATMLNPYRFPTLQNTILNNNKLARKNLIILPSSKDSILAFTDSLYPVNGMLSFYPNTGRIGIGDYWGSRNSNYLEVRDDINHIDLYGYNRILLETDTVWINNPGFYTYNRGRMLIGDAGGARNAAQTLEVIGSIRQSGVISSLVKTNASGDLVSAIAGTDYQAAGSYVPTSTMVNGHALNTNVVVSASDITTGTLPDAQLSNNVTKQGNIFNGNNQLLQLDPGGKVPFGNLPATLFIYKGLWNAPINSPALADGSGTSGWIYQASWTGGLDSAIVNLGSGNMTVYKGDELIYNGTSWQLSTSTKRVNSVNGQQGVVVLNTDNISEGSTNLYWTNARGDARYPQLSGSYSNPSWLASLPWSKITGTPTTISGYGITDFNSLGDARWLGLHATADNSTQWNGRTIDFSASEASPDFFTTVRSGIIKFSTLSQIQTFLGLGSNAYTSTAYLPLNGGTMTGVLTTAAAGIFYPTALTPGYVWQVGTDNASPAGYYIYRSGTGGGYKMRIGEDNSINFYGPITTQGNSLTAGAIIGTTATFYAFPAMGANTPYFTMYDAVAGGSLKYASVASVQGYLGLGSAAYVSDANLVHRTGNESIAGIKTFTSGEIDIVGANTNYLYINRATPTNEAAIVLQTNAVNKWTAGMRALSTDDYVLYDFTTNLNALSVAQANGATTLLSTNGMPLLVGSTNSTASYIGIQYNNGIYAGYVGTQQGLTTSPTSGSIALRGENGVQLAVGSAAALTIDNTLVAAFAGNVTAPSFSGNSYPYNGVFVGSADAAYAKLGAGSTSGYATNIFTYGGGSANPNIITFTTASVERTRIDASGNVGIGTPTPVNKLDVAGTVTSFVDATHYGGLQYTSNTLYVQTYANATPINIQGSALNVTPAATFISSISALNGNFKITEDATFVYLQSYSSKPLQINQLGNQIRFSNGNTTIDGTTGAIASNAAASFANSVTVTLSNASGYNLRSGSSNTYAYLSIGRTSDEASVGIAGHTGDFVSTSTLGDLTINNVAGNILIGTGSNQALKIDANQNLNFNYNKILSNNTVYRNMSMGAIGFIYRDGPDAYLLSNAFYNASNLMEAKYTSAAGMGQMTIAGAGFDYFTYNAAVTAGSTYTMTKKFGVDGAGTVTGSNFIGNWNGYTLAVGSTANTVALRDGNGYLQAVYYYDNNSTIVTSNTITSLYAGNGDKYIYKYSASAVNTFLGINTGATLTNNITGNAATVTTNANLTGPVTSVGNVTSIPANSITNTMIASLNYSKITGGTSAQFVMADGSTTTTGSTGTIVATGFITSQTTTQDVCTYTVGGSNTLMRASGTAAWLSGTGSVDAIISYTDETGTVQSWSFSGARGFLGAAPGHDYTFYAKAGTIVHVQASVSGGTPTYNAQGFIQKMQ